MSREEIMEKNRIDQMAYELKDQCSVCVMGKKPIGPRSGCEVRKKLVIDKNRVAWKNKHLFLDSNGKCKMFKEI